MKEIGERPFVVSVRALAEFVCRTGDIDDRMGTGRDAREAMAMGVAIHKKMQKEMGETYRKEVSLFYCCTVQSTTIRLDGRADGVYPDEETGLWCVDEIKGIGQDMEEAEVPQPVHWAQALCYGFMYAVEQGEENVVVQLRYCHPETGKIRIFRQILALGEMQKLVEAYLESYALWVKDWVDHCQRRRETVWNLPFPFPFRRGQQEVVRSVYASIREGGTLFLQASTGLGKTLAVLYPAVIALGRGCGERIFYLTAKTITGQAAAKGVELLEKKGACLRSLTLTAKDKVCFLEKRECQPDVCPYAKGYYDRYKEGMWELIHMETHVDRNKLREIARRHVLCPFELALDGGQWMDILIGDYNYAFDPRVRLQRFVGEEQGGGTILLVDEAHNLGDRARKMYSPELEKEGFLQLKKAFLEREPLLARKADRCSRAMAPLKKACDGYVVFQERTALAPLLQALWQLYYTWERLLQKKQLEMDEESQMLYFALLFYLQMAMEQEDAHIPYGYITEEGHFRLRLFCVDPGPFLRQVQDVCHSTVFFSATLLPMPYYQELLGAKEAYTMYARSPFDPARRFLAIAPFLSSRFTRRSPDSYRLTADTIAEMMQIRPGHYMAFFPSFAYLEGVASQWQAAGGRPGALLVQKRHMTEEEREAFVETFRQTGDSLLGMCVTGGLFSEGIDLEGEALMGVAIVGTGLGQMDAEEEILREHYQAQGKDGFGYAYRYPGMNRVLQAAGRVIRTEEDRGVILLLDDRFLEKENQQLFPLEWEDCFLVSPQNMQEKLKAFWEKA